jgi:hypothetical protein
MDENGEFLDSYGIKIIKGEFHWISGIYASLEEGILGLFSDLADFTNEKSTMTGDSRQREDASVFGRPQENPSWLRFYGLINLIMDVDDVDWVGMDDWIRMKYSYDWWWVISQALWLSSPLSSVCFFSLWPSMTLRPSH